MYVLFLEDVAVGFLPNKLCQRSDMQGAPCVGVGEWRHACVKQVGDDFRQNACKRPYMQDAAENMFSVCVQHPPFRHCHFPNRRWIHLLLIQQLDVR